MEPPRDAPLEVAIERLRDADRIFVRLALSQGDDDRTVLRSLKMDVLPERWLNSHDQSLLAPWLKDQRVFECQSALFFCGLLPGDTVRRWFTRPDDCGLTGFDGRPGYASRRVDFSLPELHNTTVKWRLPSYGLNGAKTIPYPSSRCIASRRSTVCTFSITMMTHWLGKMATISRAFGSPALN